MERFRIFTIFGLAGLAILAATFACAQSVSQQNPVSCTPVLVATPDRLNFTAVAGADSVFQQALTIINKGTGDLNWVTSDNSPWIEIQQASGTSGSQGSAVNVVVNVKNMSAGDYTGIVTIAADGALNSPVYVPVFLTIAQSGSAGQTGQVQRVTPPVPQGTSTPANSPGDSAAAWKNQTDLYRYAGAYSCIVTGSVANTDAIWYMGDVQIITKSGNRASIADAIQPGEQVIYHRYIPCFDNEDVRLSYRWYRP
jgi:hypothetical protein